jgi:molybdopterin converting factor small subunit
MQVYVRLYGILRDALPAGAKGRVTLALPQGATVGDLRRALEGMGVKAPFRVARNEGVVDGDAEPLEDGDRIDVFRSSGGGAAG